MKTPIDDRNKRTKVPLKKIAIVWCQLLKRVWHRRARKTFFSSVSWVDEQLKFGLDRDQEQMSRDICFQVVWFVMCLTLISMDRSDPLTRTQLWNTIIIAVLRWQEARACHRGSERHGYYVFPWPFATVCCKTEPAPADTPQIVTLSGFPPIFRITNDNLNQRRLTDFCTHCNATCWKQLYYNNE